MKHIIIYFLFFASKIFGVETSIFETSVDQGLKSIANGDINAAMNLLRRGINCHRLEGGTFPGIQDRIVGLIAGETDHHKKAALLVYSAVVDLTAVPADLAAAMKALNDAEKEDHDLPEVYNTRGAIHYMNAELREAVADYSEAIHLNPHYVDAFANRSAAYRMLGQKDLSLKDFAAYQDLLNSVYYAK